MASTVHVSKIFNNPAQHSAPMPHWMDGGVKMISRVANAAAKVLLEGAGIITHPIVVYIGSALATNATLSNSMPYGTSLLAAHLTGMFTATIVAMMRLAVIRRFLPTPAPSQKLVDSKSSSIVSVTKENYQKEVLESKVPVVVDAYASWHPVCKIIAPVLESLSRDFEGKVKFVKFNMDENAALAKELQIRGFPTFLCVKDGKLVHREVGVSSTDPKAFAFNLIRHFI